MTEGSPTALVLWRPLTPPTTPPPITPPLLTPPLSPWFAAISGSPFQELRLASSPSSPSPATEPISKEHFESLMKSLFSVDFERGISINKVYLSFIAQRRPTSPLPLSVLDGPPGVTRLAVELPPVLELDARQPDNDIEMAEPEAEEGNNEASSLVSTLPPLSQEEKGTPDDPMESPSSPSPMSHTVEPAPLVTTPKPSPPKVAKVVLRKTSDIDEPERQEQWRVGKAPGHQGSHVRNKRRADVLEEDKPDSTTILKRPFRPPTRVGPLLLPKVKAVAPPSPPPTEGVPSSPPSGRSATSIATSTSSSRPIRSPSLSNRTARTSKPFRTPARSAAPSPQSVRSRTSSAGKLRLKDLNPDAELIATLETRVRTLRQAVKYVQADEDERLSRLVHTWREAGREVTDRLFALLPQPEEEVGVGGKGSMGWGWDEPETYTEPLSKDQLEYLANARSNDKGEMVDDEGIPLFGGEDDIESILDQACAGSTERPVEFTYDLPSEDVDMEPKSTTWDRGAMLLRLGVDPSLLGYDADADDWEEISDD